MKIWELTETENDYNCTPDVIHRWNKKPTMEMVAKRSGYTFPSPDDEVTLKVVKLWQGEGVRFSEYGSHWLLEEVSVEEI